MFEEDKNILSMEQIRILKQPLLKSSLYRSVYSSQFFKKNIWRKMQYNSLWFKVGQQWLLQFRLAYTNTSFTFSVKTLFAYIFQEIIPKEISYVETK